MKSYELKDNKEAKLNEMQDWLHQRPTFRWSLDGQNLKHQRRIFCQFFCDGVFIFCLFLALELSLFIGPLSKTNSFTNGLQPWVM